MQQIDGTLSTIEFQREALENASTNTEVLNVMGAAAKALKVAHGKMYVKHLLSKFRFNLMKKMRDVSTIAMAFILQNDFKGNSKVYCCGWVSIASENIEKIDI